MRPAEKLILLLLCDIHKHLEIEGEVDPNLIISALGRHEWALESEYYLTEEPVDRAVVTETAKILTMWRVIESSYDKQSATEKKRIRDAAYPASVEFEGFDGNHDPHYGVASFYVDKLKQFEERKGRAMNSHTSTSLPSYRRMLKRFEQIEPKARDGLSADDIVSILKS